MTNQAPEISFPNLGLEIYRLPKEAFTIAGFSIYWYSIFIVLGVAAGALLAVAEAKRIGQNPEIYMDFLFYVLITSLIGARLYYVVFSWDNYKDNLLKIFAFREGGLAIYGGVIAALLTAIIYTRIKKLEFWKFADVCGPCLVMGQAIGRWGNFFNREVFGHYTDSLLAMRYLKDTVSVIPPSVLENIVIENGSQYIQVQPTFLYESLWNLFVFFILTWLKRHKKMDGEVILGYFFGYGIGRFIIEGIRTDQLPLFGTGLPVSQVLSAVLVIGSAAVFAMRRHRGNEKNISPRS
ncbi:MAG: prolipoprotein diacylglyceryl transferase [Clostridiales bacterium]|jgi:phosphatidylglycerol:prolipoprotein diacylglycerol transferase|nr:prolipoprotein diacylglyceryl transferase [Clostridiales bacterium]